MMVLRFCYGFSFGFTVAVTTSMFAEISPAQYRGKGILLINFCISIGKIYAVLLGWFFLRPQLAETNWKLMMVCGGLPNVAVLLGSLYLLEESPRYLLVHQQIDKGLFVLEKMLQGNGREPLTVNEEEDIRAEFEEGSGTEGEGEVSRVPNYYSFGVLLQEKYLRKVVALMSCWIIINFCFYGQLVIEAFHLSSKTSSLDLSKYFLTVAG
jgi:MFS family permease